MAELATPEKQGFYNGNTDVIFPRAAQMVLV